VDYEVVGLLIGFKKDEKIHILDVVIGENLDKSPVKFTLDPHAIIEAHKIAEMCGLEVVGLIHSHTGSTIPSNLDLEGMKLWPFPWVIVDSRYCTFRAWLFNREIKVVSE
jgi:proteasome lid subunit RPN8/RPN11